ncbi:MAG: enoyl-CoA hydratase [Naasia sp.]|nr:enoyl-CoA hydratase [Naasia sp.]
MNMTDYGTSETTEDIVATRDGRVLTIRLNRPQSLNAITGEMVDAIGVALDTAEADDTRVVVFTGTGRGFSAGADLLRIGNEPGASQAFLKRLQELYVRIAELPLPVIAAVNGTAMGGGTELILAADFAIAAESAKVGDGHTNVGVIPGAGGAALLHKRVPPSIAKYVVFTGDRLTARQWLQYGLFAEVVPDGELEARVAAVAARLAAKSPLGLGVIKRVMRETEAIDDRAAALDAEWQAAESYVQSADYAEGLRAFAEKRAPEFLGR